MPNSKRDATEAETEKALIDNAARWNGMNPSHQITIEEWRGRQAVAVGEGYKSEVCSCGVVFLAFHHLTTCRQADCPFSTRVSVLEHMAKSLSE